jgi:hypothetical protein
MHMRKKSLVQMVGEERNNLSAHVLASRPMHMRRSLLVQMGGRRKKSLFFQGPAHEEEELDGADGWEKKKIILLMCFQGHVHEEEELVNADGWEKRRTISLESQQKKKKKKKKRGGRRRSIYPSAIEKLLRVDEKIVGMSRASACAACVL